MNIIILDDYQDAVRKLKCAAILESYNAKVFTNTVKGIGQLSVRLRDAEVLVLIRERTHFPRQLLEKLPKLKLISQTGKASGHIDMEACTRLGIAVAEGQGSPVATAELTWALTLAAMRRLPQYIGNLKHGAWQSSGLRSASMPANFGLGMVLKGKTLGIWGYGRIGRLVAGYGRAFGMNVVVWGSADSRAAAQADGYDAAASCEAFFESCDVLSLHLRLNDKTRGIVKSDALARMKPTALLVNTSRAELIEEGALVQALNRGRPGMAAVDVFESEPILQGHPLLRLENAVCTPHIGYVEQDSYELFFRHRVRERHQLHRRTPDQHRQPRGAARAPMTAEADARGLAQVRWALLFGNFVIGCGVMAVVGVLNDLTASLKVSVARGGQLIAIAAAVMCFCGAAAGRLGRRLRPAPPARVVAGLVRRRPRPERPDAQLRAALAGARGHGAGAAVFTPQAAAAIGHMAPPAERGRSITFIFIGWSVASVVGMPMAAWIGETLGWRTAFGAVAVLGAVAGRLGPCGDARRREARRRCRRADWRARADEPGADGDGRRDRAVGRRTVHAALLLRAVLQGRGSAPTAPQIAMLFFWFGLVRPARQRAGVALDRPRRRRPRRRVDDRPDGALAAAVAARHQRCR